MGQRNEAETGLYFYKARFYDPALGRFIQPDTLVPDPASSAAYDRYAYVNNNPINFNDPSGNKPCDEEFGCSGKLPIKNNNPILKPSPITVTSGNQSNSSVNSGKDLNKNSNRTGNRNEVSTGKGGYPTEADPSAPPVSIGTSVNSSCNANNLVWCFYNRGLLPTGKYNVTNDQMKELMTAVYYDINNRPYMSYLDRARYDTPFWDGYGEALSTICIEGNCYEGMELNYLAQGMYSGKYETYDPGLLLVDAWKQSQYHQAPSDGTIYWFTAGYDFWMDQTFQIETNYYK